MNAVEIEEAISNLAAAPFEPDEFAFAFLQSFGNKPTTLKRLRKDTTNNIHIKVCPAGKAAKTLTELKNSPATAKAKFVLATDGADFHAEDLNSGEVIVYDYPDFPDHFGFFLPLAGISTVQQIRENAFDIKATARLQAIYSNGTESNILLRLALSRL